MAATAEHKLINATDRGEGRHWDFEIYVTLHKEQYTILQGVKEYGYAGMDEGSKTRHPCCQQNQPHVLVSHLIVKEICDQVHFHLLCSNQAPKRKNVESD